ncbi:hypothetical protein [Chitinimonas sp.]|uniref:hypothetical protein n=1 Tax=Chitinimonas sp. TaxID=1934313 RepID=UPI0035AF8E39
MLENVKRILPFGQSGRIGKFSAALNSRLDASPILAMQALTEWLGKESIRGQIQEDGIELLQANDEALRAVAEAAVRALLDASTNQAKTTLLLRALVPYSCMLRDLYGSLLASDIVSAAKKAANAPLIRAAVASWLFWNGRYFFARFVQDGRPSKLPWHEIQPTVTFSLALPGNSRQTAEAQEAEQAPLRRQLASLVLLSRSLSGDLQGRQLLVAERIAESFADHTHVSTQHSASTPFGHARNDDNPPTVLSQLPTKSEQAPQGLFYGLAESVKELVRLEYQIRLHGELPPALDGGQQLSVAEVLTVIKHLQHRWNGQRIKRQSERQHFSGDVTVLHGFAAISERLLPPAPRRPYALDPARHDEHAEIVDASLHGLGLKLVKHTGWLTVGQLLAIKLDSEAFWRLGIVRRAVLLGHREMQAGLQLLGKAPELVKLRRRSQIAQLDSSSELAPQQAQNGLLLQGDGPNEPPLLICAGHDLEVEQSYDIDLASSERLTLRIGGVAELGSDCVLYSAHPHDGGRTAAKSALSQSPG